ncbi:MAG: hypothetical protein Q8N23_07290 [Archangium sp.]|nr:hypothetical protein [Archangium sp.]MDP3152458.1 hypothetical protein [Archangium sp.]MDP3572372.1 hypothetical protein [Archangium sp.]
MQRIIVLGLVLSASLSVAQGTPEIPNEKVIIVPMGDPYDAGVAQPPPAPQPEPIPQPQPPPPQETPPQPDTRTIEALPPPPPLPEQLDPTPPQLVPSGPGAMIDGHPREGAFLSGPGSLTFLMHHTLMTGFGVLATQLIPRAIDAGPSREAVLDRQGRIDIPAGGCPPIDPRYLGAGSKVVSCSDIVTGEDARLAYLTGTLVGAGIGFTSAAIWQFNNWISHRSANFGILSSLIGGMFLGGFTDLVTGHGDAYATSWMTMIGSSAGAWLAAIVGGGDIALNKATLIVSGAAWAAIYTALIVAIVATTGGAITPRSGLDAVMLMPAIGAGVMALATLKFNPSVGQIIRANIFGAIVGGAVLALSGLLLGPTTGFTQSPVPYILAGVGAIGAKTLVSLLWADAAENPGTSEIAGKQTYRGVW